MDWFVRSCILISIIAEKPVNSGHKINFLVEPIGYLIDISKWWPVQQKSKPNENTRTKTKKKITMC